MPQKEFPSTFPITTSCLDEDSLFELVQSLDNYVSVNEVRFHHPPKSFSASPDAAVLASLITGGVAILTTLINGLFLLWSKRVDKKNQEHILILRTSRNTLTISSEEDLPTPEEIKNDHVIEIRLDRRKS
jgi:hypothetical protein